MTSWSRLTICPDRGQVPVRILNAGIAEMRAIVMFCKFFAVYLQDSKYCRIFAAKYITKIMETDKLENEVNEPAEALTYGMSTELRNSELLNMVRHLSHEDKVCLIRYIYGTEKPDAAYYEELADDQHPYTMEELNAHIDEAEAEIDRGEGKSFEEMMNGFKKELLWLK